MERNHTRHTHTSNCDARHGWIGKMIFKGMRGECVNLKWKLLSIHVGCRFVGAFVVCHMLLYAKMPIWETIRQSALNSVIIIILFYDYVCASLFSFYFFPLISFVSLNTYFPIRNEQSMSPSAIFDGCLLCGIEESLKINQKAQNPIIAFVADT